ncbi:MAG: FadR family transcriptional regulator [Proteobacteria bacterium]|nr:MAG: FadR family transcriptional regulator [Pseudomonadota bacterium]
MNSEFLLHMLQQHIDSGEWEPGARLPTERALARQYGIGRNTVRRVLGELESRGRIVRHVGRGTFVAHAAAAAGAEGVDASVVNPEEMMEARILIEPLLARLVVARASNVELDALRTLVKRGGEARSMSEFEQWDNKLHRAIVRASKNQYLIGIVESMHRIRRSGEWGALRRRGLTDDRRRAYQHEHEQIVDALCARDAERARQSIIDHLSHVRGNLLLD